MSGDTAAATFIESLADADVAALKRLINSLKNTLYSSYPQSLRDSHEGEYLTSG